MWTFTFIGNSSVLTSDYYPPVDLMSVEGDCE